MAQGFDPNIPGQTSNAISSEMRIQFNALDSQNSGATAPTNPSEGRIWLDTAVNKIKIYKNGTWNEVYEIHANGNVIFDGGSF